MENVNELRINSDLKALFPPALAKALDALVKRIIAEHSDVILAFGSLEKESPVNPLASLHFFVVWNDAIESDEKAITELTNALIKPLKADCKSIELHLCSDSRLFEMFFTKEPLLTNTLKRLVVLYDAETIVPMKAVLAMDTEWNFPFFKEYLRVPISREDDAVTQEMENWKEGFLGKLASSTLAKDTNLCKTIAELSIKILAKFDKYVEAILYAPDDSVPSYASPSVLVLINDTDVEKLSRIELKLKIDNIFTRYATERAFTQPVVSIFLSEFFNSIRETDADTANLFSHAIIVFDKGVWSRLQRAFGNCMKFAPEGRAPARSGFLRQFANTSLWLGKFSPNSELRSYGKRHVSGWWGLGKRIVDKANAHESVIVIATLWIVQIGFIIGWILLRGWNAGRILVLIIVFFILAPFIINISFRALVKLKLARFSPFIMPPIMALLTIALLLYIGTVTSKPLSIETPIASLTQAREQVALDLRLTSEKLEQALNELQKADQENLQFFTQKVNNLTEDKERLEKEVETLQGIKDDQAQVISRIYVDFLDKSKKEDRVYDNLSRVLFLILGVVLAYGIRWLSKAVKGSTPRADASDVL